MTAGGLTILAVDDEDPALVDLSRLLRALPHVGAVDCASTGGEALHRLAEERYDAVFLDVRMPGLDGLELARVLRRFRTPPAVIFVSAYETGAVDAFELEAIDYLMKPVSRRRAEQAIARVRAGARSDGAGGGATEPSGGDLVPVDTGRGGTRLISRASILYVQARGDYVRIVADSGRFLLRGRISEIERRWRPFGFVRTHRGYLVNLRHAVEVRPRPGGSAGLLLSGEREVPIARRKAGELRRLLRDR